MKGKSSGEILVKRNSEIPEFEESYLALSISLSPLHSTLHCLWSAQKS